MPVILHCANALLILNNLSVWEKALIFCTEAIIWPDTFSQIKKNDKNPDELSQVGGRVSAWGVPGGADCCLTNEWENVCQCRMDRWGLVSFCLVSQWSGSAGAVRVELKGPSPLQNTSLGHKSTQLHLPHGPSPMASTLLFYWSLWWATESGDTVWCEVRKHRSDFWRACLKMFVDCVWVKLMGLIGCYKWTGTLPVRLRTLLPRGISWMSIVRCVCVCVSVWPSVPDVNKASHWTDGRS